MIRDSDAGEFTLSYTCRVVGDPQGVTHEVRAHQPYGAALAVATRLRGTYPPGSVVRVTHQGSYSLKHVYEAVI